MRKRLIGQQRPETGPEDQWLDLENMARVEMTSEDPAHPIESALAPGHENGWRAGQPGEQQILLFFDTPQRLSRIFLRFDESVRARTQEFALRWSSDQGTAWHEIVRQQYNFSPTGTTSEIEDYQVELAGVTTLELQIIPDLGDSRAYASLSCLRLA